MINKTKQELQARLKKIQDKLGTSKEIELKKLSEFEGTEYYNVGVGKGYSVQEVVAAVKRVSDVDFKVEIGPRRVGDPAAYFADNSKISNELGWFPEFTLEDIVNHAWAWEKGGKLNHS